MSAWLEICKRAGVDPMVRTVLTPEKIENVVEQCSDRLDAGGTLAVIAKEAFNSKELIFLRDASLIADDSGAGSGRWRAFIDHYFLVARLLNAFNPLDDEEDAEYPDDEVEEPTVFDSFPVWVREEVERRAEALGLRRLDEVFTVYGDPIEL